MAIKRSALGKGLGALITENSTVDAKNSVIERITLSKAKSDEIEIVPVKDINILPVKRVKNVDL